MSKAVPISGNCHLCGQYRELRNSHVWSRFGYKRYASDQARRGIFADLSKLKFTGEQYKYPWCCDECEITMSRSETYAAKLCKRFEDEPEAASFSYEGDLFLRFATSISWRSTKFALESPKPGVPEAVKNAYRRWRDFLNQKVKSPAPYTQHVFLMPIKDIEWHRAMGTLVSVKHDLVWSQIGLLFFVGIFRNKPLSTSDLRIWDRSMISASGGELVPMTVTAAREDSTRDFRKFMLMCDKSKVDMAVDLKEAIDN